MMPPLAELLGFQRKGFGYKHTFTNIFVFLYFIQNCQLKSLSPWPHCLIRTVIYDSLSPILKGTGTLRLDCLDLSYPRIFYISTLMLTCSSLSPCAIQDEYI